MASWLPPLSTPRHAASRLGLASALGSVLDLAGLLFGSGPGPGLGSAPGGVHGTVRRGATAPLSHTSFRRILNVSIFQSNIEAQSQIEQPSRPDWRVDIGPTKDSRSLCIA